MRIGAFARAARATPRAVRHYHQLGLLPEPARGSNGYREYELADLVRMLRITWLARAGIPLAKIGELLDHVPDDEGSSASVARDLHTVALTMQAERDRLDRQLAALAQIRHAVDHGRALSALPARLVAALDVVAGSATGRSRAVIEKDREMLEVMALSGELTEQIADAYVELAADPQQLGETLRIGAAYAALEGAHLSEVDEQIDDLVEAMLDAPAVQQLLVGATADEQPSIEDLAFYMPDPAQREVAIRLFRRLS